MSYRRKSYTYEDGDAIFPIPFDYIEQDDILVFINDEQTTDFVIENTQVKLNNKPLETPAIIKIVSVTDIDKAAVEWENVSSLDEDNLILSDNQIRYAVQELYDNTEQFKVDINNTLSEVNEAARLISTTIEAVDNAITTTQEQAIIATEQANLATEQANLAAQQSELVASTANQALEDIATLRTNIDTIVEDSVETVSGLANVITNNAQNIINRLGINLFDTKVSDHVLEGNEALGWALQGTYVNSAVWADFYAECVSQKENATATETTLGDNTITMYINGNGHQFYDIADKDVVDIFYNSMGVAWFYGIDTENERIFLPRNNYFAVTGGVMGNGIALGLTDGTNNFGLDGGSVSGANGVTYGVLNAYGVTVGSPCGGANPNTSVAYGVTTDPTNSGITLEPDENKYLYICVGNTVINENLVDVGKVMKEAVLRSSLEQCQVVTETYSNGASWYRVYSDGWCEQGGTISATQGGTTVTFLKPFINTNYTVVSSTAYRGYSNDAYNGNNEIGSFTTTSCIFYSGVGGNTTQKWVAQGYTA